MIHPCEKIDYIDCFCCGAKDIYRFDCETPDGGSMSGKLVCPYCSAGCPELVTKSEELEAIARMLNALEKRIKG